MRDDSHLELEALLYASGELEGAEAEYFEQRLADDPSAREALCQAVQLSQTLTGTPARPNPAYRMAVRRRLAAQAQTVPLRRGQRGHPLVWMTLGAAAAVLVMLGLSPWEPPPADPATPTAPAVVEKTEPEPKLEPVDADTMLEMATRWTELHNSDHLERALEEEARRRSRAEDRYRPGMDESRRPRLLGKPSNR
jgi:hypothetical protein